MRRFTITFTYTRFMDEEPHEQVIEGCQFSNGCIGFCWQPPYVATYGAAWEAVGDTAAICKNLLPYDTYWSDSYRFEWLDEE